MPTVPTVEFAGTKRFRVVRCLGAGGMGVVYEALDRQRKVRVALKTLRALDAEALFRLKNEFHSLQDLQHRNLVSLGELVEESGNWFLTMELVDGPDFLTYVRRDRVRDKDFSSSPSVSGASTQAPPIGSEPTRASGPRSDPLAETLPASGESGNAARLPPVVKATADFHEQRLRESLLQLAQALTAIHAAGMIHRDIKPSNVLVTREGRVVVLDFGLVSDAHSIDQTSEGVIGTVGYMAPEQAACRRVGPAADWYAVGVMMYEALCGRLPFVGRTLEVLQWKQQHEPPRPSTLCAGIPADLDALTRDLLRLSPDARPTSTEVLRRLGAREPSSGSLQTVTQVAGEHLAPFVGRGNEMLELRRALEDSQRGAPVTVLVEGESGVGKSALVRRFTESLGEGARDPLVLAGRCYERESVPYKAFDGVVDALCRHLRRLTRLEVEALLPRMASMLAQVFPVLRRIEAIAEAPRLQHEVLDPQEIRNRVFAALRELLGRVAERRPLVIVIDDLQWADADSLMLLDQVLRPPDPPQMLLIGTFRPVPEMLLDRERLAGEVRRIALERLPPDDARRLAMLLLERLDGPAHHDPWAIAREAEGHPLFIDELVRHAAHARSEGTLQLEEALWRRVARLEAPVRQLLEVIAVAGAPVRQDVAADAVAMEFSGFIRAATQLRVGSLVRTGGAQRTDSIEPYHDRVRAAVLGHLDDGARRAAHKRLAHALELSAQPDPEALAIHLHAAGENERAARHAATAADQAVAALAFERATRLYRMALELAPPTGEAASTLRRKLGDALANAGHGAEAAEAYLAAAVGATAEDALEMQRRAATQLVLSGHIDEGLAALESVLTRAGMKLAPTPRRALASLLLRRARLRLRGLRFRERPASQISREELTRIDICWYVGTGLSTVDTIRGADFQARHLLLALDAGEPQRLVRAFGMEAAFSSCNGLPAQKRTAKLLDLSETMARRVDLPYALAIATVNRGLAAVLEGRFAEAEQFCSEAASLFRERCSGVWWELDLAEIYSMWSLFFQGRLAAIAAQVPDLLRNAQARGDLFAETNLRSGLPIIDWLARGDPDGARRECAVAIQKWSQASFHVQHALAEYSLVQIDLYAGDGKSAHQRMIAVWPKLQQSLLLRIQLLRAVCLDVRARAAIAAGEKRDAEKCLSRLRRERTPYASALAGLGTAGLLDAAGQRERAVAEYAAAGEQLQAVAMNLQAAAARRRHAELVGGDQGAAQLVQADAWFLGEGVRDPARLAAIFTPAAKR
jgi:serine/threonine protein kinase/tetratricopeptide (TPR) repeat protein